MKKEIIQIYFAGIYPQKETGTARFRFQGRIVWYHFQSPADKRACLEAYEQP
jgi:hypothetical protein